jgi:PAS domain S-box-containing protein
MTSLASESERRFQLLVDSVRDYAIYMLDTDGVVTNWNRGAERIKGYRADEIIGQRFSRFYTPEDLDAGVPDMALHLARTEGRFEAEGWRVRKDGQRFWAWVTITPTYDEGGRHIGFAKVTRDISERRQTQLDLERAHEKLAQAQKMEAVGKLTGGVAHDFNNLLMVMSGQAQLLRKQVGDNPRALRALEAIEMAARRGQDLTRQLLAFARRQRLRPTAIRLSDRARALRDLLSASLGSAVRLEVDLPESLWAIEVDPGELDLTLLNMAVNARDAMPSGGVLTIRGENVALDGGAEELAGDFVAITVRDTGQGIPPDILQRIFEPFFTTKDVNRGTGLGLSQVYGFVEQSGGRVIAASELGHGTSFTLYLPRTESRPDQVIEGREPDCPAADHGASILVVEDNPEVVAKLLEQLGARPQVVSGAQAALEALADGSTPDLVFSDIVMAGPMDGLDLARQLRKERPDLPILLATGYSQAAERIVDEFPILNKPYESADLSRAISALLARRAAASA